MPEKQTIVKAKRTASSRVFFATISVFVMLSGLSLIAASIYELFPGNEVQPLSTEPQALRSPSASSDEVLKQIDGAQDTAGLEAVVTASLTDYYGASSRVIRLCASAECFTKYSPDARSNDKIEAVASSDLSRQKDIAKTIINEISTLPQEWSASMLPEMIMISQSITYNGINRGGLNYGTHENQVVLLVDTKFINYPDYTAATLHHELFHSYKRRGLWTRDDVNGGWQTIEQRPYQSNTRSGEAYSGLVVKDGYASNYANISIEEDQAETYAFFITKLYSNKADESKINDTIASQKIEYMKSVILKDVL